MTVGGSRKRFMKWRILDRLCLKDQKYQQDIFKLKGTGNITSCYGWYMLELRHFYRFLDEFRGPESWGASSEAIHFHHFCRRGHFRRGGSTKGGLCLGSFVGMGVGFLGCFRHASEKGKKKGENMFFCWCNPFHQKWRPKQDKSPKMKWIQIGSNCRLPFVTPAFTLPLGGWEDSQKAEEYAHLTRSASWHGQFWVVESIYFLGRFQSSELAVTRWILRGMSVVFRLDAIEIHEDHHFSSTMNQSDATNGSQFHQHYRGIHQVENQVSWCGADHPRTDQGWVALFIGSNL